MAYTAPPTFANGQLIAAADLNSYIRDNENYLLGGYALQNIVRTASGYTISNTSFADVDATNLNLSLTVQGGRAFVLFYAPVGQATAANTMLDLILDSTTRYSGYANGAIQTYANGTQNLTFAAVFTGLSAGVHTVKLQARVSNTANGNGSISVPAVMIGWGN